MAAKGEDMTQNEKVLRWFENFDTLTAQSASKLHIWRLAARIGELRSQGHDIETEMVTNGRVRYARYRLVR